MHGSRIFFADFVFLRIVENPGFPLTLKTPETNHQILDIAPLSFFFFTNTFFFYLCFQKIRLYREKEMLPLFVLRGEGAGQMFVVSSGTATQFSKKMVEPSSR